MCVYVCMYMCAYVYKAGRQYTDVLTCMSGVEIERYVIVSVCVRWCGAENMMDGSKIPRPELAL